MQKLVDEYGVSTKSVTRSINDLKTFLAEFRDIVGNTERQYSYQDKCYHLYMDGFLTNKELFAQVEVMMGARAFSGMELLVLTDKLKRFTTTKDRNKLNELIRKELYHYSEVNYDCNSVQDILWQFVNCIKEKREITADILLLDKRIILSEDAKCLLDVQLQGIREKIDLNPEIKIVYFDEKANKLGGGYVLHSGKVKKIEEYPAMLVFLDGKKVLVEDIFDINF